MKFSEWLKDDTVAILHVAIYYGIPKYGHEDCYRHAIPPVERVTIDSPDIRIKHCIACGKRLIPESEAQS